jgi:sugar phosphate isomerase/epimerase
MIIGCSTSYMSENPVRAIEEVLAEFDAVEISGDFELYDDDIFEQIAELIKKKKARASVHAPITDTNLCSPNRRIREESISQAIRCANLCSLIGARIINVHPGRLPMFSSSAEELESIPADDRERYLSLGMESIKYIHSKCSKMGISLCVENMPSIYQEFGKDVSYFRSLFSGIDSEYLGMTLDLGHANTVSPGLWKQFSLEFGERTVHYHIHDNHGSWDEHLVLGKGNLPISDIAESLFKKEDTDKLIVIEGKNLEEAIESRDVLSSYPVT